MVGLYRSPTRRFGACWTLPIANPLLIRKGNSGICNLEEYFPFSFPFSFPLSLYKPYMSLIQPQYTTPIFRALNLAAWTMSSGRRASLLPIYLQHQAINIAAAMGRIHAQIIARITTTAYSCPEQPCPSHGKVDPNCRLRTVARSIHDPNCGTFAQSIHAQARTRLTPTAYSCPEHPCPKHSKVHPYCLQLCRASMARP